MTKIKKKAKIKLSRDQTWLNANFERLIDEFEGQYVVVSNGESFVGSDAAELQRRARKKSPDTIPLGMPIPHKKDLLSLLNNIE